MTDERIAELEKLCAEATPAPWTTAMYDQPIQVCGQRIPCFEVESETDSCWIAKVQDHRACADTPPGDANALFIATARTALPEALAEIRRLKAHFWVVFNRLEHNREAREELGIVMKELGIRE